MANKTVEETRSVNIASKVTPGEAELIRAAAEASGLTSSDWCRKTLLGGLHCSEETRFLLSELLHFKTLTLSLIRQQMKGVGMTDEDWNRGKLEIRSAILPEADKLIAAHFAPKAKTKPSENETA